VSGRDCEAPIMSSWPISGCCAMEEKVHVIKVLSHINFKFSNYCVRRKAQNVMTRLVN